MKNSLRAVNDRFEDSDDVPPPVRVIVAEGDEDVTIKVSLNCAAAHELCLLSCTCQCLGSMLDGRSPGRPLLLLLARCERCGLYMGLRTGDEGLNNVQGWKSS